MFGGKWKFTFFSSEENGRHLIFGGKWLRTLSQVPLRCFSAGVPVGYGYTPRVGRQAYLTQPLRHVLNAKHSHLIRPPNDFSQYYYTYSYGYDRLAGSQFGCIPKFVIYPGKIRVPYSSRNVANRSLDTDIDVMKT